MSTFTPTQVAAARWLHEQNVMVTFNNTVLVSPVHDAQGAIPASRPAVYVDAVVIAQSMGWKNEIPAPTFPVTHEHLAALEAKLFKHLEDLRRDLARPSNGIPK